jgi:hypothetical protein
MPPYMTTIDPRDDAPLGWILRRDDLLFKFLARGTKQESSSSDMN